MNNPGTSPYVFVLADDCAVIEWWFNGRLDHITVSDLRHTRAAGGPFTAEVGDDLKVRRADL